jgi:hypothetical protein
MTSFPLGENQKNSVNFATKPLSGAKNYPLKNAMNRIIPSAADEARMRLRPAPKKPDPLEQLLRSHPAYQAIPLEILPHARAVPLGVMVRGILEWLFDEDSLRRLFREHAPEHYERELTLSALVSLLIQVSA